MNKDPIKEKITRWSLDRVQFLLSHIEGFIETEDQGIKERAKTFVPDSGLEKIERLVDGDPSDPNMPFRVLERLASFFDAGILLQKGPAAEKANWWTTDLFWRGNLFHLELKDQVEANRLVPEMPPLQVQRTNANKMLTAVKLQFLAPSLESDAFLIKPTHNLAYILINSMGEPWSIDHVAHAHRLVNKCFIY